MTTATTTTNELFALFAEADRIGNKYQSQEEIEDYGARLDAAFEAVEDTIAHDWELSSDVLVRIEKAEAQNFAIYDEIHQLNLRIAELQAKANYNDARIAYLREHGEVPEYGLYAD